MGEDIVNFLRDAAANIGCSADDILRSVLHLDAEHAHAIENLVGVNSEATTQIFRELDRSLRVRNPGLHYVIRGTYLGYRREGVRTVSAVSSRSQIFASVLRKSDKVRVILPIPPEPFLHLRYVRDLSLQGHHGVGQLECSIKDMDDLRSMFQEFDFWLKG